MQVVLRPTNLPLPRLAAHGALDAPRPVFVSARLRKMLTLSTSERIGWDMKTYVTRPFGDIALLLLLRRDGGGG